MTQALIMVSCSSGSGSPTTVVTPPVRHCDGSVQMSYAPQQTSVWCWAAAAQMVIGSYGQYPQQCQVASIAMFGPAYYNYCCYYPGQCQTPGPSAWIANAVYHAAGKVSNIRGGPISFAEIKANIDACSPVVILYSGSFVGHFVVLQGYDEASQTVSVYDPVFGVFPNVPYATSFYYAGSGRVLTWAQTVHNFR